MTRPVVITIAGSDPSGGAGIQADLQTFHHFGVQGCSVITAVTAQSLHRFDNTMLVPVEMVLNQLSLLPTPAAIKIGMLASSDLLIALKSPLLAAKCFVVLDPLMTSSTGANLFAGDKQVYRQHLLQLFPAIDLITPNKQEAEWLLQRTLHAASDIEQAAKELLQLGVKQVLLKGGHFNQPFSQDYWTNGSESCWLSSPRQNKQCHGTGCVTSSAIAAAVASGYAIKDALVLAKMYVNCGIRLSEDISTPQFFHHGTGLPNNEEDLPYLNDHPLTHLPLAFDREDQLTMGLYPIVDNVEWLKKLLPLGIKHIQLRIKDKREAEVNNEIQAAVQYANQYAAKLYINDYWQLALKYGAYGVHLGQEDLLTADVDALQRAGIRLGISTHSYHEVARAHAYAPSYLACGTIYPTTSKIMSTASHGIEGLRRYRQLLRYPLVAIGGINLENIAAVAAEKVNGIAMISAITQADNYQHTVIELMQRVNTHVK